VTYFAYTSAASSSSTERREVSSPFLRIDVDLSGKAKPKITRLRPRVIGSEEIPVGPLSAGDQRQEEARLQSSLSALFRWIEHGDGAAGGKPGEEAAAIRAGYNAWAKTEPALAAEIKRRLPSFFRWLSNSQHVSQ
jgi:hypothetical protein